MLTYPVVVIAATATIIVANACLSFHWMWRRAGKAWHVLLLSTLQLALFTLVFQQLYVLGGVRYYLFSTTPQIADWCRFTMVHVLRAMDFMDAIESYGWQLHTIKSHGYVSGTPVVLLHLLVDFFLFTALYKIIHQGRLSRQLLHALALLVQTAAIAAGVVLTALLLWYLPTSLPLLLWIGVCAGMAAALWHWGTEISPYHSPEYLESRLEGVFLMVQILAPLLLLLALPILLGVGILCGSQAALNVLGVSLACCIGLLLAFLALYLLYALFYAVCRVQIVYIFFPLLVFTALFSLFFWWATDRYPQWVSSGPPLLFALENLFAALDLTDMTQVYAWNWSHVRPDNWLFASVVVSYRFLVSAFFYQYVYKLLQLRGAGNILPMDKKVAMLEHPASPVRDSVIRELLAQQDRQVVPYVLPFLVSDDIELRRMAVRICVRLGTEETIPHMATLCLQEEMELRREVMDFLRRFDSKHVAPCLLPALRHVDAKVRQRAAATLADLKIVAAAPQIMELLGDSEPQVQREAIRALGELAFREASDKLMQYLREPTLASVAIETMGKLGATAAIPEVVAWLDDKRMQGDALLALGKLLPKLTIAEIACWLVHPIARHVAVEALIAVGVEKARPHLLPLLADQDSRRREAGAFALGALAIKESGPHVLALLTDPSAEVRAQAIVALGKIGTGDISSRLVDMLHDDSPAVRNAAIDLLVKRGDRQVVPALIEMLASAAADMRNTAATALSHLGARESIPQLLPLLQDSACQPIALSALVRLKAPQIACAACGRTQLMEMEREKYWCSWCENWATIKVDAHDKNFATPEP